MCFQQTCQGLNRQTKKQPLQFAAKTVEAEKIQYQEDKKYDRISNLFNN
jgi:hypothetical protein